MKNKKFLGNIELICPNYLSGKINVLMEKNYGFFHALIPAGGTLHFNRLSHYNVACLNTGSLQASFGSGVSIFLEPGDIIYSNGNNMLLESPHAEAALLIAGVMENSYENLSSKIVKVDAPYKVKKPWGQELWLNVEHPDYAFKEIRIKAGQQTSLQYHKTKEETLLITEGQADLIFHSNSEECDGSLPDENLSTQALESMQLIHIPPRTLHRLTAKTDICLYEVSTGDVDDVVRVADDFDRKNGRIESEHLQNC